MSEYSGDGAQDEPVVSPLETVTVAPGEALTKAVGPLPPLPDPIVAGAAPDARAAARLEPLPLPERFRQRVRMLRAGCYVLRYTPVQPASRIGFVHYDGTMRVEREGRNTTASGDLYIHRLFEGPFEPRVSVRRASFSEPNPAAGIPIFPRRRYRYYVRVTQILELFTFAAGFTLGFELHRFDHSTRTFTNEGAFTADMSWTTAPPGYPSSNHYLSGDVKNSSGTVVGNLTMGWVSKHLRRATIEIDRVSASEAPLDNGSGTDWPDVFAQIGWQVNVVESDTSLSEPSGQSWSDAEMHAEMLARRDSANLDAEWRYHIICVRRIDSTERGIMYDNGGTDSNNVPREGAGIASHWVIPNEPQWGLVQGMRFGEATAPYYRTAVHELGHAFGLYHNTVDLGFMNTTDVISASAVPPQQFPDNVQWSYAPDDTKRLRHMPDIWVRPGGIAFGASYSTAPISSDDLVIEVDELSVEVEPLLEAVPVGAPVRVNFALTNRSDQPLPVPASLSLKSGFVRGKVIDASGIVRSFWPLVRCIEQHELRELQPGETATHSLTLLRGAEGALFPASGPHRVIVEVEYDVDGLTLRTQGEASVMVTGAVDDEHARAALKVLTTPDTHLTLALGGDHLDEGIAAIHVALENPVLRPHYAVIEAKRVGNRFRDRAADVKAAAELLDDSAVMSGSEIKRAAELLQNGGAGRESAEAKNLVKTLQDKVRSVAVDRETEEIVKAL